MWRIRYEFIRRHFVYRYRRISRVAYHADTDARYFSAGDHRCGVFCSDHLGAAIVWPCAWFRASEVAMRRVCTQCNLEKPLDEFYRLSKFEKRYRYACKDCNKTKAKQRRLPDSLAKVRAKEERDSTVAALVEQRVPLAHIASHVGVTKATVKNILQRTRESAP
jgi:transposase-like protein